MTIMENTIHIFLISFCVTLQVVFGIPWNKKGLPVCTSRNSLCDVTFDIPSMGTPAYSEPICQCPGKYSCEAAKKDPSRTITQEMISPEESVTTKLSFCDQKAVPSRMCENTEIAVTLRGIGPIIYDIVGDISCRCSEPLVLQKSVPDGPFSMRYYACGKPTCDINRTDPPVCERVTASMYGFGLESELPCRCPDKHHCLVDSSQLPFFGGTVDFYCRADPL